MPAKRERDFHVKVRTHSTKRRRARVDQVVINKKCTATRLPDLNLPSSAIMAESDKACMFASNIDLTAAGTNSACKSHYEQKKEASCLEWAGVQEELREVYPQLELPASFRCAVATCAKELSSPIRCLDCHYSFVCCEECEVGHHHQVLHKPEIWNVCKT